MKNKSDLEEKSRWLFAGFLPEDLIKPPIFALDIRLISMIYPIQNQEKQENMFEIKTEENKYFQFSAPTQDQANNWVYSILISKNVADCFEMSEKSDENLKQTTLKFIQIIKWIDSQKNPEPFRKTRKKLLSKIARMHFNQTHEQETRARILAMKKYRAKNSSEISFKKGDWMILIRNPINDVIKAQLGSLVGNVITKYVEIIDIDFAKSKKFGVEWDMEPLTRSSQVEEFARSRTNKSILFQEKSQMSSETMFPIFKEGQVYWKSCQTAEDLFKKARLRKRWLVINGSEIVVFKNSKEILTGFLDKINFFQIKLIEKTTRNENPKYMITIQTIQDKHFLIAFTLVSQMQDWLNALYIGNNFSSLLKKPLHIHRVFLSEFKQKYLRMISWLEKEIVSESELHQKMMTIDPFVEKMEDQMQKSLEWISTLREWRKLFLSRLCRLDITKIHDSGLRVFCLGKYKAKDTNELSFNENEFLLLLDSSDSTTWVAQNSKGKQGKIPANRVEIVTPASALIFIKKSSSMKANAPIDFIRTLKLNENIDENQNQIQIQKDYSNIEKNLKENLENQIQENSDNRTNTDPKTTTSNLEIAKDITQNLVKKSSDSENLQQSEKSQEDITKSTEIANLSIAEEPTTFEYLSDTDSEQDVSLENIGNESDLRIEVFVRTLEDLYIYRNLDLFPQKQVHSAINRLFENWKTDNETDFWNFPIYHEGPLYSFSTKRMEKHWVVVRGWILRVYISNTILNPIWIVDLRHCKITTKKVSPEIYSGFEHAIRIDFFTFSMEFFADSVESQQKWMEKLEMISKFHEFVIFSELFKNNQENTNETIEKILRIYRWIENNISQENQNLICDENLLQFYSGNDDYSHFQAQKRIEEIQLRIRNLATWRNRVLLTMLDLEFGIKLPIVDSPAKVYGFSHKSSGNESEISNEETEQEIQDSNTNKVHLLYDKEEWFSVELPKQEKDSEFNDFLSFKHPSNLATAVSLRNPEKKGLLFTDHLHMIHPDVLTAKAHVYYGLFLKNQKAAKISVANLKPPIFTEGTFFLFRNKKFGGASWMQVWMILTGSELVLRKSRTDTKKWKSLKLRSFSVVPRANISPNSMESLKLSMLSQSIQNNVFQISTPTETITVAAGSESSLKNWIKIFDILQLFNFLYSLSEHENMHIFKKEQVEESKQNIKKILNWIESEIASCHKRLEELNTLLLQSTKVDHDPNLENFSFETEYNLFNQHLSSFYNWRIVALAYLLRCEIGIVLDNNPRCLVVTKNHEKLSQNEWVEIIIHSEKDKGKLLVKSKEEIYTIDYNDVEIVFPAPVKIWKEPQQAVRSRTKRTLSIKKEFMILDSSKRRGSQEEPSQEHSNSFGILETEREQQAMRSIILTHEMEFSQYALDEVAIQDAGNLCHSLVYILESSEKSCILDFIEKLILKELDITNKSTLLFRGKSPASKMMSEFAAFFGEFFLKKAIQKLVQEVILLNENLEIYPGKLDSKQDKQESNVKQLEHYSRSFLDSIFGAISYCPIILRDLCQRLSSITNKKFPNSTYVVLSGFVFLRFICPAIIAPERFNIIDSPPPEIPRRALVLISKVIQGVANGILFMKESPMEPLNNLLSEYIPLSHVFMDQLISPVFSVSPISTSDSLGINSDDCVVVLSSSQLDISEDNTIVKVFLRKILNFDNLNSDLSSFYERLEISQSQIHESLTYVYSIISKENICKKIFEKLYSDITSKNDQDLKEIVINFLESFPKISKIIENLKLNFKDLQLEIKDLQENMKDLK
ncbi:ras gtpase-activating protein [Anaeramoeba ignava]|uniref:Ras gtpase-activating protein n=1 Tax=Anaeramoeba ignava TaxID=1746090 RepID=A0A9Q0R7L7_ANAIG|nr:ras gtpase-activating protein [Anaeramoeba ignava]